VEKILGGSRSTIRFNAEEKYSQAEDLALHLMGPGECAYEHLRLKEILTVYRYQQQLCRLSDELMQKRSSIANNRCKIILLHDNIRPHIAKSVKQTLYNF